MSKSRPKKMAKSVKVTENANKHKILPPVLWDSVLKSLDLEAREHKVIRGASGLDHNVLSIGVDDKNKRIVLVSSDPDPRIAAMMQIDVRAAMPDTSVLVARPIIVDLGVIARQVVSAFGTSSFHFNDLKNRFASYQSMTDEQQKALISSKLGEFAAPVITGFQRATLPTLSQIVSVIHQAAHFDWKAAFEEAKSPTGMLSIESLANLDNMKLDRDCGICPIPLYEFKENDWEVFSSGKDIDAIQFRLKELGIYHYFFPSPDQLALGSVDRGFNQVQKIESAILAAPENGHPLSAAELLDNPQSILDVLDGLTDRGFVAEGESGYEVTEAGKSVRHSVRYRPREGVISKVMQKITGITINNNFNFPK